VLDRDSRVEYEAAWSEARLWIEQSAKEGLTDPVEIVRGVTKSEDGRFLSQGAFQDYYTETHQPVPKHRLGIEAGAYRLFPFEHQDPNVLDTLAEFIASHAGRIDAVVELGSGIGRNLFMLASRLRRDGTGTLAFHACEYTSAGRDAAIRLSELGKCELLVHAFDYRQPDLSFLDRAQNVLFFSVHSLEQITIATESFIDEMLARTAMCYCLHFEPVGWQLDRSLVNWRENIDRSIFRRQRLFSQGLRFDVAQLGIKRVRGFKGIPVADVQVGSAATTSLNAARWSARFRYNKNLIKVLHGMKDGGRIEIFREEPNTFGSNPFNPTTIIGWRKR